MANQFLIKMADAATILLIPAKEATHSMKICGKYHTLEVCRVPAQSAAKNCLKTCKFGQFVPSLTATYHLVLQSITFFST